jgi:TolB-like protein/Tfp pilus assembly protein PilF
VAPILRHGDGKVSNAVRIFSESGTVQMGNQTLVFGPFAFDVKRSLLLRGEIPVALGQRGAALLAALLTRRGDVLAKAELLDAAWPGAAVEESNLSVQIALLRRTLGRTPEGGEWILTVERVGYRFAPAVAARAALPRLPTLAVLRFTDFDTGTQPEADGFVEDLTSALARFRSIAVMARSASFHGRGRTRDAAQAARRLGADYVIEGSVRRISGGLRANVQLIDGAGGSHLWAHTFDAPFSEPPAAFVGHAAAAIEAEVQAAETARSRAERRMSASPYDLYLRAKWLLRPSDEKGNREAHGLLKQALRLDPENIHILAATAEVLHHRRAVGWPALGPDDERVLREAVEHGLDLGTADGAALGLFSNALFTLQEWDMARVTMERAVAANPDSTMALACAGLGSLWLAETGRAERYFERAAAHGPADPNRRFTMNGLAAVQRRRGNYEAAIEFAKQALAVGPGHSGAHWNLIAAAAAAGRMADARRYAARFRTISPATTVASIKKGQPAADERLLEPLLDGLAVAGVPEA